MTLPAYLDQVEARATAASKGPWTHGSIGFSTADKTYLLKPYVADRPINPSDLPFIAASRTDIPALVAMLREAVGALEDVKGYLDVPRGLHAAYEMRYRATHALAKLAGLVPEG